MPKRIGLDCRLAGTKHTGIGRYISELFPKVINQAPDNWQFVLFISNQKQKQTLKTKIEPAKLEQLEFNLTPVRHYSLKEQWQMEQAFRKAKLDLLHVPHFNKPVLYTKPTVVTIHDLLWHKQKGKNVTTLPSWLYYLKYLMYRMVVANAIASSQAVIVPSKQTKKDILSYWPKTKSKIYLTYEGVSLTQKPTAPKKILPKNYLLYVGSLYPHKNIQVVLKAMLAVPKTHLVIVSARNIFQEKTKALIKELKLTQRVIFFDWVSDDQLAYLYQQAKVLIQPSFHEGFGLTGIEALSYGTPVIASKIDVFKEVYGQATSYFDPKNEKTLAKLIKKTKSELKKSQTKAVLSRYSWDQCAQKTLRVYAKNLQTA